MAALRALALAASLTVIAGAANADGAFFKDTLRPGGADRSLQQKYADGRACGLAADNTFHDTPAFRQCMQARGWVVDHMTTDPAPTWIDPDTGMECHKSGAWDVCRPPHGTVQYTNKHGVPCTRTGAVSVCKNF
jgi:hypothetical protein